MATPDHDQVDAYTAEILAIYASTEVLLYQIMARRLKVGITDPGWHERQIAQLEKFHQQVDAAVNSMDKVVVEKIPSAISGISDLAQSVVEEELATAGVDVSGLAGGFSFSTSTAAATTMTAVQPVSTRMSTVAVSTYRNVIDTAISASSPGDRLGAAQRALNSFATQGVTGFVDKAGRSWDMVSYVEMAVRTSLANVAVDAHAAKLSALGFDLVIVSNAIQECYLCRPFEGKVLSLSGVNVGQISSTNPITGQMVSVYVYTSLDQARGAGLHHPNCRHSESAYLPGVTTLPTNTEDIEGDAARQKLRYLERQKRAWKRRELVALDENAAKDARKHIAYYNDQIKKHVSDTSVKRQPNREQLNQPR